MNWNDRRLVSSYRFLGAHIWFPTVSVMWYYGLSDCSTVECVAEAVAWLRFKISVNCGKDIKNTNVCVTNYCISFNSLSGITFAL